MKSTIQFQLNGKSTALEVDGSRSCSGCCAASSA